MDQPLGLEPGTHLQDEHHCIARVLAVDRSGTEDMVIAQLQDHTQLAFPLSLLRAQANGYRFDGDFAHLAAAFDAQAGADTPAQEEGGEVRIPVVSEALQVERRLRETGAGVRIVKRVQHEEKTVDLPLLADDYLVEHIARDELLPEGETPTMRHEEDGSVVLPVLEEVLVVQKRLRLREEIRITRKQRVFHEPQQVVLRREDVEVQALKGKRP